MTENMLIIHNTTMCDLGLKLLYTNLKLSWKFIFKISMQINLSDIDVHSQT